eukprot:scaffold10435_cov69-Cyclotella_meneghiniana.AAC.1
MSTSGMSQSTQSSPAIPDGWDEEESVAKSDDGSVNTNTDRSQASDSVATTDGEMDGDTPSGSYVYFGDLECRRIYTIKASKSRTSATKVVCGRQVTRKGLTCRCSTHLKYQRAEVGYYPGLTLRDGTIIGKFTYMPLSEDGLAALRLHEHELQAEARASMQEAAQALAAKSPPEAKLDSLGQAEASPGVLKSVKTAAPVSGAKKSEVDLSDDEDSPRSHSSKVVIDTSANISATYDPDSNLSALTDDDTKRRSRRAKKTPKKTTVAAQAPVDGSLPYFYGFELRSEGIRTFAATVAEDERHRRNGYIFRKAFNTLEEVLAWIDLADSKPPALAAHVESSDDESTDDGEEDTSVPRLTKRESKSKKASKSEHSTKRRPSKHSTRSSGQVSDYDSDDPSSSDSSSSGSSSRSSRSSRSNGCDRSLSGSSSSSRSSRRSRNKSRKQSRKGSRKDSRHRDHNRHQRRHRSRSRPRRRRRQGRGKDDKKKDRSSDKERREIRRSEISPFAPDPSTGNADMVFGFGVTDPGLDLALCPEDMGPSDRKKVAEALTDVTAMPGACPKMSDADADRSDLALVVEGVVRVAELTARSEGRNSTHYQNESKNTLEKIKSEENLARIMVLLHDAETDIFTMQTDRLRLALRRAHYDHENLQPTTDNWCGY